ncbi:MAG: GAF domain-containing protein [Candidatus Omnitrophica bacterium]|nr:GAF domain-containing protein [Candidatus Omnitrophota bacterium]
MVEPGGESLPNLINVDQWAFILSRFAEVLGVDVYTVDPRAKLLTLPQHTPKIWELIAAAKNPSRLKFRTPSEVIQSLIRKSEATHAAAEGTESLGFTYAVIPIFSESSRVMAYLVVGPLLLGSRRSQKELEGLAKEQGWDLLSLEGLDQEAKLFSFVGMKAMLELLSEVCNYLVQPTALKGGHEQILSEFTSSWKKDLATKPDELDNFFSTLLDLALRATKADSGSVMVLDSPSQTLRIRAALGLNEEVIQKAEVKVGEGVAGWVAQRNRPLLIDPEMPLDPALKHRLKRSEIDSSIVMPLSRQEKVLGILSINSHKRENRLKAQNLDLLAQLAKLTMVIF